jgi:hypothetical protein
MVVVIGNCRRCSLSTIESSGGEAAIQIIQNLTLEAVHEEFVSTDVGEGDVGDIDLLGSIGEEQRMVAV